MPIKVEIAGKGVVAEFPDGTDENVINAAIQRDYFGKKEPVYKAQVEGNKAVGQITDPTVSDLSAIPTQLRQDYPIRRKVMEVARPVMQGTAAGLGGVIGTGAGPIGTVAGSALGYGIGSNLSDILEEYMGIRRPTAYGASPVGRLHKAAEDVKTGAMIEMGGQAAGTLAGGIIREMSPLSPNAKMVGNLAKRENVYLSPADLRQEKGESLVEQMFINAPLSATQAAKKKLKTIQGLTNWRERILAEGKTSEADVIGNKVKAELDKFITDTGLAKQAGVDQIKNDLLRQMGSNDTYESLSVAAKDILAQRSLEAANKKNALYFEALRMVPEEKLNTTNLSAKSDELLEKITSTPNPDSKLVNVLRWGSSTEKQVPEEILAAVQGMPPEYQQQALLQMGLSPDDLLGGLMPKKKDMATLLRFRNDLNSMIVAEDLAIKGGNPSLKGQLTREGWALKEVRQALDKDLEAMAAETGGETWQMYQAANKFYGQEYAPVWKNKTVQKMAYSDPNSLIKIAFRPNNVPEINTVRKALGEEGFDKLKRKFTQEVFTKSPDFASAEKMINSLGDSANAIYTPAELKLIKDSYTNGIRLEGAQLVDKKLINLVKSLDGSPDLVVDKIIRPHNTTTIRRVLPFLSKETREEVEYKFLERLMAVNKPTASSMGEKFLGPQTSYISPAKFETQYHKYGEDTIKAALSPKNFERVQELLSVSRYANASERIAGNPSGTAQNLITWTTLGIFARDPVHGTMIALAPPAMAKFYFSDAGFKLFTKGIKTPALTPKGVELTWKIYRILNNAENKDKRFEEIVQGGNE